LGRALAFLLRALALGGSALLIHLAAVVRALRALLGGFALGFVLAPALLGARPLLGGLALVLGAPGVGAARFLRRLTLGFFLALALLERLALRLGARGPLLGHLALGLVLAPLLLGRLALGFVARGFFRRGLALGLFLEAAVLGGLAFELGAAGVGAARRLGLL